MENLDKNQMIKKEKHFNILKWILVLGIIVVLNLFFSFAIKLVYDSPEYTDFCTEEQVRVQPDTEEGCIDEGGQWSEKDPYLMRGPELMTGGPELTEGEATGYCDTDFTCRQEFDDKRSVYNKNVFVVLVILGVASLVAGIFISATSVSIGLSLGGVLSLIIGSIRYWSDMDDILRVIMLGVALLALIWVGIKKLKD
ncbi:MAG TPA: hypothetical protein QGH03_01905 [Candidatus Paceibacterota bacterium]|jgi:hypothetical protein|nr:hypothetical protein [Parcubacteria group bacterium]HJN62965.1 hypothetical protein [Candidatus Paceibacterota bacterium]|tara:strand:+ start:1389 stop:1979 length:591 start_codon:yes stop_codon:yes gene_type:complete